MNTEHQALVEYLKGQPHMECWEMVISSLFYYSDIIDGPFGERDAGQLAAHVAADMGAAALQEALRDFPPMCQRRAWREFSGAEIVTENDLVDAYGLAQLIADAMRPPVDCHEKSKLMRAWNEDLNTLARALNAMIPGDSKDSNDEHH